MIQFHRRIPLIRRPFWQRDQAIRERDALTAQLRERDTMTARIRAERDELRAKRDAVLAERDKLIAERDALIAARVQLGAQLDQAKPPPVGRYSFEGYEIPVDLMMKTGGGPESFEIISTLHIDNIRKYVGVNPSSTVLEIGCGIGRDAIPLTKILSADLGGHYIGLDIIRESIDWCTANIQVRNPHFIFHHIDISDRLHNPGGKVAPLRSYLPVPDQFVDRVILPSVFTHMLPDELGQSLREIRRVMKPDALLYATVFIYDDEILACARRTNLTAYDLRFEHELEPGCRINDLAFPTGAVAYSRGRLDAFLERAELHHARAPLRGAWSGFYEDAQDGQDVLIVARADNLPTEGAT
jgi:SAM-dependent methyltransferase